MTTLLFLARHGETADNAASIFQGQSGKGLNARGRAQAARLASRLKANPPDVVIASDLQRAVETARAVADACGRHVVTDPALREVDVGLWTGKGHEQIAELYPEEWAAWSSGLDVRRGGGETYAELAARIDAALQRLLVEHAGKRILVVSHGGSIKSWIVRLLGASSEGLRALAGVGNCGLSVVLRDARGRLRLESFNDTSHLEGLVVDEGTD